MSWVEWFRLGIEAVVGITAVVALILSIQNRREQRAREPQLGPGDAALLIDLVEHDAPLGAEIHADDRTFVVIDVTGPSFSVSQGGNVAREVSRTAFANLERLGMVAKTRHGYQITPEGYAAAKLLQRRAPWRSWRKASSRS